MTNAYPQQNKEIAYTVIDEQAVLVNPSDSAMYWLNPVASLIWENANGTNSPAAIAQTICDAFDVDQATALRDVEAMIAAFAEKQLFLLDNGKA